MATSIGTCDIEIIERTDEPDPQFIMPTEVRINGSPVYTAGEHPIVVHEMTVNGREPVLVTLTLYAHRVTMGAEPKVAE